MPGGAGIDSVSGLFTWTPSEVQGPGVYPLTVRAEDDLDPARFDTEAFTVTVQEVNAPPVLVTIGNRVIAEGSELSFTAAASDPDLPANGLVFSLAGAPAGAAIDPASGLFTWTPSELQGPGDYGVTVQVTDDGSPSLFDTEAITVTVQEVNEPPVLGTIGDREVEAEVELTFTATASDPDTLPGLTAGLLAYWPFDTDFQSVIGSHHGTPVGGAAITATVGEYVLGGGGLKLDGVDDHVSFGDLPLVGDFTVSAWVNPTNILAGTSSQGVVLGDNDNADWLRLEADGVRGKWDNATTVFTTEPDFVNGSWQHFVLVRSGTAITVYRDGVVVTTGTKTQTFTPEFIGWKNSGSRYGGTMDDLAVWGRALESAEVTSLYNGGAGTAVGATAGVNASRLQSGGDGAGGGGDRFRSPGCSPGPRPWPRPRPCLSHHRAGDRRRRPAPLRRGDHLGLGARGGGNHDQSHRRPGCRTKRRPSPSSPPWPGTKPRPSPTVLWRTGRSMRIWVIFWVGHDGTAAGDAAVSATDVKLGAGALGSRR